MDAFRQGSLVPSVIRASSMLEPDVHRFHRPPDLLEWAHNFLALGFRDGIHGSSNRPGNKT